MKVKSFRQDVGNIAAASAFAQTIAVATTPVFTRLYDPATVGVAAVFMATVFSIAPVSSLSYNQAIVLAKDDEEARNLAVLSFMLTLAVSVFLLLPCAVFDNASLAYFTLPQLEGLLWLLPVSVFVKGAHSILIMESSRTKGFRAQGYSRVLQIGAERLLTLGSAFFGKIGISVLIVSRLISYLFEAAPFTRMATGIIRQYQSVSLRSLRATAVRYRHFPLYANWTNLSANLSAYAAIFIISFFFTAEFVGLYAMTERLLLLPLAVFGDSLKIVYYQKAASQRDDRENLRTFFHRLRMRLLVYGIFPTLLLLFFGREIFTLFLGPAWALAGSIAGVLCVLALFQFISSPIMSLVNVVGKQRQFFLFTMLLLGARCISFVVGGLRSQPMLAIWLVTISGSVIYVAINLWMDRVLLSGTTDLLFQIAKYAFLGAGLLACVTFTRELYPHPFLVPIALLSAGLIYYTIVLRTVEDKTLMVFMREMRAMMIAR